MKLYSCEWTDEGNGFEGQMYVVATTKQRAVQQIEVYLEMNKMVGLFLEAYLIADNILVDLCP